MLRKQEQGVARRGQHLEVTAIDVRLRDAAIKLQLGGAGFFPGIRLRPCRQRPHSHLVNTVRGTALSSNL